MAAAALRNTSENWLWPISRGVTARGKMAAVLTRNVKWLGLLVLLIAVFAANDVGGQDSRYRNGGRNGEEKIPYSQ